MELQSLMQGIMSKNIPKFLIFFGEEQKIADIYVEKIIELGYKRQDIDTVAQAVAKCSTKSLDKTSKLYVVCEDKDYQKAENSWEKVKSIVESSGNVLLIRYGSINKTYKFYKRNSQDMVEFKHLDNNILSGYISRLLPRLSHEPVDMLCEMCGNDYGRIILECDKIKQYQEYLNVDEEHTDDCFYGLLEQGAIYSEIGDITFQLTNAIAYGDMDNALKLLDSAKRAGEPALRICSILYTNFKNMLSILCLGSDRSNASARTGIENRYLYSIMKHTGAYSIKECIRNVRICQEVESGIKTGRVDAETALDYLLVSLMR